MSELVGRESWPLNRRNVTLDNVSAAPTTSVILMDNLTCQPTHCFKHILAMASAGAPTQYERLVMDALASRDATIPPDYRIPLSHSLPQNVSNLAADSKVLNGTELAIIDLTATQLRDAIAAKHYTAVQVIKAYVKAAAIAQQGTNCLVELFAEEAYERAAWLDAEYERTGKVAGPLHGVPVSVKVRCFVGGRS